MKVLKLDSRNRFFCNLYRKYKKMLQKYKKAVRGGFEPTHGEVRTDCSMLSFALHPRDRRACLPISTPYSIVQNICKKLRLFCFDDAKLIYRYIPCK